MVSRRIALFAIFLLAFEGYSVLAIVPGEYSSITTVPNDGAGSPPCQIVIPAVIKAVVQPDPAPYVASVGNYAPALSPIIIEEENDNWQNLLYLIMFAKNNKRGGSGGIGCNLGGCNLGGCNSGCGGYNGGCNGGYRNNNGGFDGYSIPYPYPYNGCSGGYDYCSYTDDYAVPPVNPSPRDINLVIKTDSGTTCTCA